MRMEKLTNPLQQALGDAQSLAVGRDHSMIEPAHLLSAFINKFVNEGTQEVCRFNHRMIATNCERLGITQRLLQRIRQFFHSHIHLLASSF